MKSFFDHHLYNWKSFVYWNLLLRLKSISINLESFASPHFGKIKVKFGLKVFSDTTVAALNRYVSNKKSLEN